MYAKVKTVRRGGRSYEYLELVEGRREGTRVRQHVVANLGCLDELKASGRLEQLVAGLARLDAPLPGTRRHVGPLLIAAHYLQKLGVAETVNAAIPRRGKALASHGEIACVLAASRLCSPSPLYDIAGWASSAAVPELLGTPAALLNDDRLGRPLESLAGVAGNVRGQLMLRAVREFGVADASRLHLDLTAVRFTGHYPGSDLVEKGWAADRTIGRQVKTLQASVPAGVTLYFRPHKGAASELPAFMAAIEALAAALPPGLVVVADSGLGYTENLCAADAKGVKFVVPLRASTGAAARFTTVVPAGRAALPALDHVSYRERNLPAGQRTTWKGLLAPFPVTAGDGTAHDLRAAYIWSSEEAASVAAGRERALATAEAALTRIRNGLGGRCYKTRKQADARAAQILTRKVADLIQVRTGTKAGHQLAARPGRDHRRQPAGRPVRAGRQPARPRQRRPADRPGHPEDLQGPVDRRAAPPRPQADPAGPARLPAQRRPDRGPHRHHRHRPADLRADRGRAAQRPRPRRSPARHPAREPRRHPHRPRRPGRLRRPAPHLHPRRPGPRPPHQHPAHHPGPPEHPTALARETRLNRANHDK